MISKLNRLLKVNKHFGRKINNMGLSLVELICAVGIMGLVGASVAGFMIVGANTYSRGVSEANLQEEAQLLASQINNIIQDASSVETNDAGDSITLERAGTEYTVYRDPANDTVYYSVGGDNAPMAEDIKVFLADATDFEKTGMVQLYICMAKSGLSYAGNYTISSRNVNDARTMTEGELTMTYVPEYVLEPNQTYPLNATMSDGSGVNYELSGNTDPDTIITTDPETGRKVVTIGKDEEATEITLIITSQTRMVSDGLTPAVQKTAKIYIRRVRNLTYVDVTNSKNRSAGFTHKLTASVDGSYLSMIPSLQDGGDPGYSSDNENAGDHAGLYNTISPKDIYWDVLFFKEGEKVDNPEAYLDINAVRDGEAGPRCDITLKQDLGKYDYIVVNMYSTHANGYLVEGGVTKHTNITGRKYSYVYGQWILTDPSGYIDPDGDGMLRGSDQPQGHFMAINLLKTIIPHDYPGVTEADLTFVTVHRFREVRKNSDDTYTYGPWTAWRDNRQEGADSNAINLRPITTCSLDYDKTYQVQVKVIVRNVSDPSIVYWPKEDTPKEQYLIEGVVNPLVIFFDVGSYSKIAGIENMKLEPDDENIIQYTACEAARHEWVKDQVRYKVQRYENGVWVDADLCGNRDNDFATSINDVYWKKYNDQKYGIAIEREGYYRVLASAEGLKRSYYIPMNEGSAYDNYAYTTDVNMQYYNEETGKGIFYFYCEKTSDKWKQRFVEYNGTKYDGTYYFTCDGQLFEKSSFGDKRASETKDGVVISAYVKGNFIYYCKDGANYEKLTCYYRNGRYELTWGNGTKETFTSPNLGNTLNNAINNYIPKN